MNGQRQRKSNRKLYQIPAAVSVPFFCKFLKKTDRHTDRGQDKNHTELLRQCTFKTGVRTPVEDIHHIKQYPEIRRKPSPAHHFQRRDQCQIYKVCLHHAENPQQHIGRNSKHHMKIINHNMESIRIHARNPDIIPLKLIDPVIVHRNITCFVAERFHHIRSVHIRDRCNCRQQHCYFRQRMQPLLSFSPKTPLVNGSPKLRQRCLFAPLSIKQSFDPHQQALHCSRDLFFSFPDPDKKEWPCSSEEQRHTAADPKKLQQINEINDIKIPCEEISDQLFCNGKPMKPLPKDPPWKKQGYDAIGSKNFQKL